MPDVLAHYAASLLVASRLLPWRSALVVAVAGLLPDLDVVFGWHRSPTHSLLALIIFAALTHALHRATRHPSFRVTALLYALHLAMDLFNAPLPLLWPLTSQAYMLVFRVAVSVGTGGIQVKPVVMLYVEPMKQAHTLVRGPLASTTGIILALVVALVYALEHTYENRERA